MTLPKYVTQEQRLEDLENIQDQRIKDLEDIAYLKKRVAELEKNQEKIIIFLTARFSQKAVEYNDVLSGTAASLSKIFSQHSSGSRLQAWALSWIHAEHMTIPIT